MQSEEKKKENSMEARKDSNTSTWKKSGSGRERNRMEERNEWGKKALGAQGKSRFGMWGLVVPIPRLAGNKLEAKGKCVSCTLPLIIPYPWGAFQQTAQHTRALVVPLSARQYNIAPAVNVTACVNCLSNESTCGQFDFSWTH